jgi:hypothetical protein
MLRTVAARERNDGMSDLVSVCCFEAVLAGCGVAEVEGPESRRFVDVDSQCFCLGVT